MGSRQIIQVLVLVYQTIVEALIDVNDSSCVVSHKGLKRKVKFFCLALLYPASTTNSQLIPFDSKNSLSERLLKIYINVTCAEFKSMMKSFFISFQVLPFILINSLYIQLF